ncbi:hypothetical protein TKK_0008838 [Trichogramma kaykai]|uniref:Cuticle protein n=1 Tax=Trichogramma kaykai TaxID=54128 RepID=A0ABD2X411_9HYME
MVVSKVLFVCALAVATVSAGLIQPAPAVYPASRLAYAAPAAPLAYATRQIEAEPYDPNPQYNYGYDVQDPNTGDYKSQQESRSGDQVRGSYSLLEADGTRRIVEYTADDHNGFNAVVRKEGTPLIAQAQVAPVAKLATYAQPALALRSFAPAPLAYSHAAPLAIKSFAPAAYAAAPAYAAKTYAAAPIATGYSHY